MPQKILCVAEKPAIAKAVAQHLAGGRINAVGTSPQLRGNTNQLSDTSAAISM